MFYVYIIKSIKNDWFYVGHTSNLENRLYRHNKGFVRSTKSYRPYKIVYTEQFSTKIEAVSREKKIKQQRILKEYLLKNINKALSSNG